ncbi:ER membrane protein DP1/Yop1 [Rhizopus stolonifer]|uniref:Protein YOP1 n=1 Tax=Rhizopus stolonifer TaxID=4846 RepID=A0A367KIP8_RHIST|nr:ER membrane protein DP1/Yop1 [Rhizopus stolonifer]
MSASSNTIDSFKTKANSYFTALDKELTKQPHLVQFEQKSGCPKSAVVLGAVFVLFLLTFLNYGARLITNILSWAYPAYASFKAIESSSSQDDTQWLTYWTVITFVQMFEYFSSFLLYWCPFYYTFKAIFTIWLILPQTKGAEVLYTRLLRPNLLKIQPKVKKSQ